MRRSPSYPRRLPGMLSPDDVADRCGLGRTTVIRYITEGTLPATKSRCGCWQIKPPDANEFAASIALVPAGGSAYRLLGQDRNRPYYTAREVARQTQQDVAKVAVACERGEIKHWRGRGERPGIFIPIDVARQYIAEIQAKRQASADATDGRHGVTEEA